MEACCGSGERIPRHCLPESSENQNLEYVDIDKNEITVSSNWKIEDNKKTLYDAVKYTFNQQGQESDLDGLVSVDSCIRLLCSSQSASEKCTLNIKCSSSSNLQLARLLVVSEARKLEVYIDHGEYFTTVCTNFVEEIDDDFIVYKGAVEFLKPVSSCSIKFASVRKPVSVWLYGLKVTLLQTLTLNTPSKVDFSKVYDRIKDSELPISDKANELLQFLAQSNKTLHEKEEVSQMLSNHLQDSKSFFDALNMGAYGNSGQLASSWLKSFNKLRLTPSNSNCLKRNSNSTLSSEYDDKHQSLLYDWKEDMKEFIKVTIAKELKTVEERLWEKLDKRLKEIEERQSKEVFRILELLATFNHTNKSDRFENHSNENL